jgi:ubiquinone/menaquinone biosynthesis C-methylase UbiE
MKRIPPGVRSANLVPRRREAPASAASGFDWVAALPRGIRSAAVARLGPIDRGIVLDVGCGAGRIFRHLEKSGGPTSRIVGIDQDDAMLAQAAGRCERHEWHNIALVHGDALSCPMPESITAALFSLSYSSMTRPREILARVWGRLRPGGRIVVLDAKVPTGAFGRLVTAGLRRAPSDSTIGDPGYAPWADLATLGARVEMEEWSFGSYFVAVGLKE